MAIKKLYQKALFRAFERYESLVLSPMRKLFWRLQGADIGRGTKVPRLTRMNWPHQVQIGEGCHLEPGINFNYDGIWKPGPSIVLGRKVYVGSGCEFNISDEITIGDDCLIAAGCRFIDHNHGLLDRERPTRSQLCTHKAIVLEKDVWLGVNVVVLQGVTIGEGSVVGAGSVCTKPIPPGEIWAGVPARKIRDRSETPGRIRGASGRGA